MARIPQGLRRACASAASVVLLLGVLALPTVPAAAAGVADHFGISTSLSATAGHPFDLTVTALDNTDAVDTGYVGTLQLSGGGPGASLPGDYTFQAADLGTITFSNGAALTGSGLQTISAQDANNSAITGGIDITVDPDAPTQLVFTTQPADAAAGDAIGTTIELRDQYDNAETTDDGSVVSLSIGSGPGVLAGTTSVVVIGGVATFDNSIAANITTAGGYTLSASTDAIAAYATASEPFTVSPGPADHLSWDVQPNDTYAGELIDDVALDAGGGTAPAVAIRDRFNNLETGDDTSTIDLSGPFASGSTISMQVTDGVASFVDLTAQSAPASGQTITATSSAVSGSSPSGVFAVVASADLSVTKSGSASPADAGTDLTYTITAHNAGPSDVVDAQVTDAVPPDLTGVQFCLVAGTGSCTPGTAFTGSVASIALTDNADATVIITGHIPSGEPVPTSFSNGASISSSSSVHDPDNGNNDSNTVLTSIEAHADLQVGPLTSTPDGTATHVLAGTNVTFHVPVTNDGPSDNTGYDLVADAPAGTTFSSTPGCTLSVAATHASCHSSLIAGHSESFNLEVAVPSSYAIGHGGVSRSLSFTAGVDDAGLSTPQTPGSTGNDAGTESLTVYALANLGLTLSTSPLGTIADPLYAGNDVTFTVHVSNNDVSTPSDAAGYSFDALLPGRTTFLASSDPRCSLVLAGSTIRCVAAGLAHGSPDSFAVALKTQPDFVDTSATNQATLSFAVSSLATTTPQNGNTSNDTPSSSLTVTGKADLSVSQVVTQTAVATFAPLSPGNRNTVHIVLTVRNNGGPSDARQVTVSDTLPGTLFSAAATTTTAGTCTGGLSASCNLGTLVPGAVQTVTIDATVDPAKRNGPISFGNVASVSSNPAVVDPVLANNSSTAPAINVATVPDTPTLVSADPGNGQIAVVWVAGNDGIPTTTGGSGIASWDIILTPSTGPQTFVNVPGVAAGGQLTATITASNTTSYAVRVEARNGVGDSSSSNSATGVTPCLTCVLKVVSNVTAVVLNTGSNAASTTCPQKGVGATAADSYVSCYQFPQNSPKQGLPLALNEGPDVPSVTCGGSYPRCLGNQQVNTDPAGEGTGVVIKEYVWVDATISTNLKGHPCSQRPCGGSNGVYVYDVFVNGVEVGDSLKVNWCKSLPATATGCVQSLTELNSVTAPNGAAGKGDLQLIILLRGDPHVGLG